MAGISLQLLILLDPRNSHQHYETQIDRRIFKRCNISQECRNHIRSQADRDKHLFLPDFETELAQGPRPGSSNTFIYVYCQDQQSINENDKKFQGRALNRIFPADELSYYLYNAGIEVLYKVVKQPPNELNEQERDELVDVAKQQLTELRNLFDQYMITQLGQQAHD